MTDAGSSLGSRVSDFVDVTEIPGIGADRAQLQRAADRYGFAVSFCAGKRVLEVACGAGFGLGYLDQTSSRTVGGDLTPALARTAHRQYAGRLDVLLLDAQRLPFKDSSFDIIVLFEALYYLPDFAGFLDECQRVLSFGGALVLSTVNSQWLDFNPSPFSTRYYAADELVTELQHHGFRATLYGNSPVELDSVVKLAVSRLKRTAVGLHLMPKSMKAKQLLRRLFLGKLEPMPAELVLGEIAPMAPEPIAKKGPVAEFKVIFVHAESTVN